MWPSGSVEGTYFLWNSTVEKVAMVIVAPCAAQTLQCLCTALLLTHKVVSPCHPAVDTRATSSLSTVPLETLISPLSFASGCWFELTKKKRRERVGFLKDQGFLIVVSNQAPEYTQFTTSEEWLKIYFAFITFLLNVFGYLRRAKLFV